MANYARLQKSELSDDDYEDDQVDDDDRTTHVAIKVDFKPDNFLISGSNATRGNIYIIDFGAVKWFEDGGEGELSLHELFA